MNNEERQKREELERLQAREDLRYLIKLPQGQRFFKRFLAEGYIFHSTYTGNSHGYFNEGKRAMALKYFNEMCEVAPEVIPLLMINDNKQED